MKIPKQNFRRRMQLNRTASASPRPVESRTTTVTYELHVGIRRKRQSRAKREVPLLYVHYFAIANDRSIDGRLNSSFASARGKFVNCPVNNRRCAKFRITIRATRDRRTDGI